MKKILAVILSLLFTFGTPIFATEEDIVDIASSNGSFETLVAAVIEADLVDALKSDGPFTVFAPTDDAFAELLDALGITAGDLLGHPQLAEVLLYHVVSGKVMSTDLSDGLKADTLKGEKIAFDLSNGVKVNNSNVIIPDIEASNGVIHVIDSVLVPSDFVLEQEETMMMDYPDTVVDIALSDDNFSMLVMLLQKADLVGALQGEGPFTVFAPTNDAFVDLVTALDITPEELMAQPELASVLLYHVVSGKVMSTDLSDGLMADTLNGSKITFDLSGAPIVNSSNIIIADIIADNGVIHVIDSVLIPDGFTLEEVEFMEEAIPETGVTSNGVLSVILGHKDTVFKKEVIQRLAK